MRLYYGLMIAFSLLSLVFGAVNYVDAKAFYATAAHYTATFTELVPDPN
jgi:hypothetical protein